MTLILLISSIVFLCFIIISILLSDTKEIEEPKQKYKCPCDAIKHGGDQSDRIGWCSKCHTDYF